MTSRLTNFNRNWRDMVLGTLESLDRSGSYDSTRFLRGTMEIQPLSLNNLLYHNFHPFVVNGLKVFIEWELLPARETYHMALDRFKVTGILFYENHDNHYDAQYPMRAVRGDFPLFEKTYDKSLLLDEYWFNIFDAVVSERNELDRE